MAGTMESCMRGFRGGSRGPDPPPLKIQKAIGFLSKNWSSRAGSDNNHAHPDTSMKLGRNVH